jgi:hypothetical protein
MSFGISAEKQLLDIPTDHHNIRMKFGRSRSHEHLPKDPPASRLKPNDSCGCGSGRAYKKCCSGVPKSERPPWDVFSIRERNLMFANAVLDILGPNKGKARIDVRRDLSDEQVRRIHEVLAALWPADTNVAQLLPDLMPEYLAQPLPASSTLAPLASE